MTVGPADKAKLQPTRRDARGRIRLGDAIVKLDGRPIEKAADLFDQLEKRKVGEVVRLAVVRDGNEIEVDVTLGAVE